MIVLDLLAVTLIFLSADPVLAQKKKDVSIGVLNPAYFVVVQDRGAEADMLAGVVPIPHT